MNTCRPASRWLLAGWLALLFAQPAVGADDDGEKTELDQAYELGAYLLDEDAWRFGKHTGLREDGSELLLDFRLEKHPKWNSGDTQSWRLQGWRLGLDSRRVEFQFTDQGARRIEADYRELPNYQFADGVTPFSGAGTALLELPAGWVAPAGGSTATFEALEENLVPFGSYWKRKRLDLAYDQNIGRNWTFDVSWRHETKDGDGTFGGVIGSSGLNARTVVLPAPIDWETDIMEAAFDFSRGRFQFGFGVYASWFTSNEASVAWQNPYGARGRWEPAAGYPGGFGRYSLEPDNEAMTFKLYGGINLSGSSRLSADVAIGTMEQDELLLDYSVNPLLQVNTPLPAATADAKIDTTHANLRYTARPLERLGLLANFTLNERDNKTPQRTWAYIGGDSEDQKDPLEGRLNLPYSYRKEQWDLTATWRSSHGLRFEAGAEWLDYERSYSEVLDSDETRLFAGVTLRRWARGSLSFDYASSERDVDEYVGNRPYLANRVPGSVDEDDFDNLPALRKYNQTDREREEYRFRADFFPTDIFSFAIAGSSFDDDYDDPEGLFGLQEAEVTSWSFDAGFYPNEAFSLSAYYTIEAYESYQTGRMWTNGITARNPANDWRADFEDDVETWNLALQVTALGEGAATGDRLQFGLDYTFSEVESEIRVTGGENIAALPLPLLLTEMTSWSIYGRYAINARLGLRLAYEQQELSSNDFALDDVPIDGSPSALLLGESAANYDLSLIMLSLSYRY